jgi:hypothetical protein
MFRIACFAIMLGFVSAFAADVPEMPKPVKEHEWLKAFVGEWETSGEASMAGQTFKSKGGESVKAIGGFWIQSELKCETAGMPMTGIMTLGYDAAKKKYTGTWVDSMTSHLWIYEGTVDAAGKVLTLEAMGPSMIDPKKMCKFKDVTEFKSDKHKVLTSWMQGDDGQWTKFMTMESKRK